METMIPRYFNPPGMSYFLFGPRGTGKSTFLQAHYPGALKIDLLQPDVYRTMAARPERLRELVHGSPNQRVIVIDEVQKLPEILSVVHGLIEEQRDYQFILTGSSARQLKRSNADLLAGRVIWKTLHPFMISEMGAAGSLDRALQYGMLPVVFSSPHSGETLKSYVGLYVREEVQQESLTRNIGNFSRFLEAISFSHASLLNISNVARECEVERKVVESYIGILEDILLGFQVRAFTKRAQRAVISHPKFYFFDTGVFRTLRPAGPLDRPEEIGGAALEGLVAQHLKAWNAYANEPCELYFWRTTKGVEVDFVLYGQSGIVAMEVKNTSVIRVQDLRGLKTFKMDYPESTAVFLYRGTEKMMIEDIHCIPCELFFRQLVPARPLSSVFNL